MNCRSSGGTPEDRRRSADCDKNSDQIWMKPMEQCVFLSTPRTVLHIWLLLLLTFLRALYAVLLHEVGNDFAGVPTPKVDLISTQMEGVELEHIVPLGVNLA